MTIAKKRSINILLAFTLLVSLFIPNLALAYEVKGEADNAKLTIWKFKQDEIDEKKDGDGSAGQTANGEIVEGAKFELAQTHTFDPIEDKWTKLAEEGQPFTVTTDAEGKVVVPFGVDELGRYKVQEVPGDNASIIINTEEFFVDVPMTNEAGTELNYDVHIYPKNEKVKGTVNLEKKDESGNGLDGVTFNLYKKDGTLVTEGLVTENGGKIEIDNLEYGEYYFQETEAPEDYAINTSKIEFEVKANADGSKTIIVWTPKDGIVDADGNVTNYKHPVVEKTVDPADGKVDRDQEFKYSLTIKTPGDIDKYKALGLTDELDENLEFISNGSITDGWEVTGTDKDNIVFKQDGKKLIWEVKDLSKLEPNTDVTVTFTAKIKPDAEFEVINNEAKVHFSNNKGSYTDPADPDNPENPYDPYDPEDPDNPEENPTDPGEEPDPKTPPTDEVTITPKDGGLLITKVDKADDSITLEGAQFKLTTDKEGNNVVDATDTSIRVNGEAYGKLENLTTLADGTFEITHLTPGTYYLHETKAPGDYRLLTKPIEVEVKDETTEGYSVENSKSAWELPTTGGIGTVLFTAIGIALMGIALFAYLRRRNTVEQ